MAEPSAYELDVCVDGGIVNDSSYDAYEQVIDAVGHAIELKAENPDRVVTVLVTEKVETARLVHLLCGNIPPGKPDRGDYSVKVPADRHLRVAEPGGIPPAAA